MRKSPLLRAALLALPLGAVACTDPSMSGRSSSSTTGAYPAFPAARTGATEQGKTDASLSGARAVPGVPGAGVPAARTGVTEQGTTDAPLPSARAVPAAPGRGATAARTGWTEQGSTEPPLPSSQAVPGTPARRGSVQ